MDAKVERVREKDSTGSSKLSQWGPSIVAILVAVISAMASLLVARVTAANEAARIRADLENSDKQIRADLRKSEVQVQADLKKSEAQVRTDLKKSGDQLFGQTMDILAKTADKDFMTAMPPLMAICAQSRDSDAQQMAFAALKVSSYACDDVCQAKQRTTSETGARSCWTACNTLKATIKKADSEDKTACVLVPPKSE